MENFTKLKNKGVLGGLVKRTLFFMVIALGVLVTSCTQRTDLVLPKQTRNYVVTKDQALSAAKNFNFLANKAKGNLKSSAKTRKVSSVDEVKDQDGEPLFYIMNYDSSGFVIVSGDNRVRPILAFSKNHSFKMDKKALDNTGLGYWIYATKNGIRKIRKKGLKQNPSIKEVWAKQLGLKIAPVDPPCTDYSITRGPLIQTIWSQGCGYNTLLSSCFSGGACGHVVTGCVATAMGQIMKYHNYPASYNWSYMPNTYGTLETARLMKDIGIAVNMGYSCDLSSASGNAIVPALTGAFGYSSAEYIDYANTANYAVVEDNLNRNQPVIFTGIDYSLNPPGGHAWVSDGYIEQFYCVSGTTLGIGYLYFHMNWGWQLGDANGWFSFNTFTPTTSSGTTYSFYSDSKVVVNIHP